MLEVNPDDGSKHLKISLQMTDYLASVTEHAMGSQYVKVYLKSGEILDPRLVAWGTWLRLDDTDTIESIDEVEKLEISTPPKPLITRLL